MEKDETYEENNNKGIHEENENKINVIYIILLIIFYLEKKFNICRKYKF